MGKSYGGSYRGPFTEAELPKPMDPGKLEALVQKLRAGDVTVSNEIIGGHMRLGMSVVSKYAGRYPNQVEDMVGAAMFGICQAVAWAPERLHDDNITPYIYKTCTRFIGEVVECRTPIRIPRKTLKIMKEEDLFVPLIQLLNEGDDEDDYGDAYDRITEQSAKIVVEHPIIFEEFLESMMLNARERTIIDMLMEDYNQSEIAVALGVSRMYISQVKQQLAERVERRQQRRKYASLNTKY